jgi:1,4-dihydroxy-2-naphthoyl-CoA hydrolase
MTSVRLRRLQELSVKHSHVHFDQLPLFCELLAHRAWSPPPSSSLAEEKRLSLLLLRATARDSRRSQLPKATKKPELGEPMSECHRLNAVYGEPVTPIHDWQDIPAEYAELTSALDIKMGFELLTLTPERVVGRMPVEGNTQPFGLWHGGASCVLAETLASLGSFVHAQPERISVGVDINATHHRPVTTGWVTGTAAALRLGKSIASYEIVITDDAGERVCTARVTCQLVTPR